MKAAHPKMSSSSPVRGRHMPFYAGLVAAALSLISLQYLQVHMAIAVAAIAFFGVYLVLTFSRLPKMDAAFLKRNAANEDVPVVVVFLVTVSAISTSIGSLFFSINDGQASSLPEFVLTLLSVALGWMSIHTMAALHYSHLYWQPDTNEDAKKTQAVRRGLEFPKTPNPSAADFLYFAFVIGMTAQTSDVVITSTAMRKVNLAHAVASFFFNTVLVAAAVNVAVSFH